MSKADTLLQKALAFEVLALYGDRKDYLTALAQASFPDVNAMVASLDNLRKNVVNATNRVWRQDPASLPTGAREAYSALAYPSQDLMSSTGEQLHTAMDQLVANLTSLYRALTQSDNTNLRNFADQTVAPAVSNAQNQMQHVKATLSETASLLPAEQEAPAPAPEAQPVAHRTAPAMSPQDAKQLQIFLNQAFRDDIIAGRMGPIEEARGFGPETAGRLREWARRQNLPITNMQALVNSALKQSRIA